SSCEPNLRWPLPAGAANRGGSWSTASNSSFRSSSRRSRKSFIIQSYEHQYGNRNCSVDSRGHRATGDCRLEPEVGSHSRLEGAPASDPPAAARSVLCSLLVHFRDADNFWSPDV